MFLEPHTYRPIKVYFMIYCEWKLEMNLETFWQFKRNKWEKERNIKEKSREKEKKSEEKDLN